MIKNQKEDSKEQRSAVYVNAIQRRRRQDLVTLHGRGGISAVGAVVLPTTVDVVRMVWHCLQLALLQGPPRSASTSGPVDDSAVSEKGGSTIDCSGR